MPPARPPAGASPAGAGGVGCYPGSFDPPTIAHVGVAEAAVHQAGLVRVDFVVSRRTLGKDHLDEATVGRRVAVLERVVGGRPWLGVTVVDGGLVADVADGYDAVIMGADKWAQVVDPGWYGGSTEARDAAVARLPRVLVAPRAGVRPEGVELLSLADHLADVSATAVREGHPRSSGWHAPGADR